MSFKEKRECLRVPLVPINWGHGRPWGGALSELLNFFPDEQENQIGFTDQERRYDSRCKFWEKFLKHTASILSHANKDSKILHPSIIAILGVPMDIGVGYRHGARFGPRAIREASAQFGSGVEGGFDISQVGLKIVDLGDVDIHPYLLSGKIFKDETLRQVRQCYRDEGDVPPLGLGNFERIQFTLEWILGIKPMPDQAGYHVMPDLHPTWKGNVFPVILGGDHSITLPCARAVKNVYGGDHLGIIYFDAHPDYLKFRSGLEETHASQAKRVADEIGSQNIFQIGIRYIEREEFEGLKNEKVHYWPMEKLANQNAEDFSEALFAALKSRGIRNIYLSVDIDVLDAGIVPGTGVPEPGGMDTRYLIDIIQNLGDFIEKQKGMSLVALDLVEVAPDWDIGNVTALAAVKIIFEALGAYFISAKTKVRNK